MGRPEYRFCQKVKYLYFLITNMDDEKVIPLKCSIEKDGTVTCNLTKEKFNEIQKENIKPKRIVFEIEQLVPDGLQYLFILPADVTSEDQEEAKFVDFGHIIFDTDMNNGQIHVMYSEFLTIEAIFWHEIFLKNHSLSFIFESGF